MLKRLKMGIVAPAVTLTCLALPGAAAQATGHETGPAAPTHADNATTSKGAFIRRAAQGGMAEVQLGELAQQKAESPQVKEFAQRMVNDHSKANDQLKQLAAKEGITVPETLSARDKETKARLEKLSGAEFDRAYMADMVSNHTHDVTQFRTEARTAKDPAVKNFASETLPTLEDHLKEARSVDRQVAGTATMHKAAPHKQTGS